MLLLFLGMETLTLQASVRLVNEVYQAYYSNLQDDRTKALVNKVVLQVN